MRTKKILLAFTALLAVGITTAACSGDDDDDDGTYTLASGDYDLDVSDVPATTNTCFPLPDGETLIEFLVSATLPIEIISTNGATFQLIMPDAVSAILPSVDGTITGNVLAANGDATGLVVGSGCTMNIVANVDAELIDDNEFDISGLTATFTVPAAVASSCSAFVGGSLPGTTGLVPWPVLTNTSSGTCSIVLVGSGILSP